MNRPVASPHDVPIRPVPGVVHRGASRCGRGPGPCPCARGPWALGLWAAACLAAAGCGGDPSGRHRVRGKVTFDGQPVPAGTIYFNPDTAAGNDGAPGFAAIVDGAFDTRAPRGRGAIAGPHTILVDGHVPPPKDAGGEAGGTVLFQRHALKKDLPKSDSTVDIAVPAEAGKARVVN